jgi:hypothetical protein
MKAHLGIATLLATAALVSTESAQAAGGDAKGFGEKSQLIFTADRLVPLFSYAHASTTRTENNIELSRAQSGAGLSLLLGRNVGIDESFMINVHTLPRVAVDFTIIPKLTLGIALAFGFGLGGSNKDDVLIGGVRTTRTADAATATAIGLAPRVGYIIPFSEVLAFWLRGGFGFYSVSRRLDEPINNDPNNVRTVSTTDTFFSLDLDPQLAIVPTEHFFFHLGPLLNIPISGSRTAERTQGATTQTDSNDASLLHFGISAGLGGWLSL